MTRVLRLLPLIVLLLGSSALAKETAQAELDRALKLFDDFEDQKASALLFEVLKHGPSSDQAAKAHVYLGLIALNALKTEKARAEFKQALLIDATTELPFEASPKARLTYDQARRDAEQEAQQEVPKHPQAGVVQSQSGKAPPSVVVIGPDDSPGEVPRQAQRSKTVTVGGVDQPASVEPGPDYAPAIVLSAIGVGALVGGIIVGAVATSTLRQAKANPVVGPAETLATQAGTQGLIADILFGVGAAGAATGIILFVVAAATGDHAPSAVHADANGLSLAF